MKVWEIQYLIMGVLSFFVAYLFYKSKDGTLRKAMMVQFITIGWAGIWVALCQFLANANITAIEYDIIRYIAITPVFVSTIFLAFFLFKKY